MASAEAIEPGRAGREEDDRKRPSSPSHCFHCGETVPQNCNLTIASQGQQHPVCCAGCQAVYELITHAGLGRYYQFRQSTALPADADRTPTLEAWQALDQREPLWGEPAGEGERELLLQVEGIRCAACAWLIRSHLEANRGIRSVQVDTATGFTRIVWNPLEMRLSKIAAALLEVGYMPHLPMGGGGQKARLRERQDSLKRLGIAGLGMMQVMMYAIGLYSGAAQGMSPAAQGFLIWVSMLVTLPVMWFSGRIFFIQAWKSLRAGRPGMDVPVALAIGLAFVASCVNFFRGQGEVWFDSVVMFIFFLTLGRHIEMMLRHKNLQAGAALARLLPEWAKRLVDGRVETVPSFDLQTGDLSRVLAGEAFPADGIIRNNSTEVNEALLTGESRPLLRQPGDAVMGGSINLTHAVDIEVTASGPGSTVSSLGRLLMRAQLQRSSHFGMPAWLVPVFVISVLIIASCSWFFWNTIEPARAFPVLLAVLVASCPCALSLALPAVHAASSRRLLNEGILLTRSESLHHLRAVDTVVFDKTGTLTRGTPQITGTQLNPQRPGFTQAQVRRLAAGLEACSTHPVAAAFATDAAPTQPSEHQIHAGQGISGTIQGQRWRIGQAEFVRAGFVPAEFVRAAPVQSALADEGDGAVWLGDTAGWVARFELSDILRSGAHELCSALNGAGISTMVLSGDGEGPVRHTAEALGIPRWHARQSPQMKLGVIEQLKADGHTVLMVGDGVNDAPVLAAAPVSVAVAGGTELANSVADLILTQASLAGIGRARDVARQAVRLVRQNLAWALVYNAAVMPLAVSGLLQPWMAAIGMSLSSVLVVTNASRLLRQPRLTATRAASTTPAHAP